MTPDEKFWSKVDKTAGCWLWTGTRNKGYGRFRLTSDGVLQRPYAHRFAYETLVGPVPAGLVLDHLCRVRHCVNPAHLEVVTIGENVLRGVGTSARNRRKTHCLHGHELAGPNLLVREDKRGRSRLCRTCRARLMREFWARNPGRHRGRKYNQGAV